MDCRRAATAVVASWLIVSIPACTFFRHDPPRNYRTVDANPTRDTLTAEKKTRKAIHHLRNHALGKHSNLAKVEAILQDALVADVSYGPAHNALGQLYFLQQKYYLAAWEFEYAARTMPNRPEPISNTGLVYEEVGNFDRAIEQYEMAFSMDPENAEIIGNLARCRLRSGATFDEVQYLLEQLVFYDSRPEWTDWARDLSSRFEGRIETASDDEESNGPRQFESSNPYGGAAEPLPRSNGNPLNIPAPRSEPLRLPPVMEELPQTGGSPDIYLPQSQTPFLPFGDQFSRRPSAQSNMR